MTEKKGSIMSSFNLGVVLMRWGQSAGSPHPPSWYRDFFCDPTKPGIADYWRQQSQGQLLLTGDVVDWLDLQATTDQLRHDEWKTVLDRTKLAALAVGQAQRDGASLIGRDGYVVIADVVVPAGMTLDAGATGVSVPLPNGATISGPAALLATGCDFAFAAHEVGHVLGLEHSFGFPQQQGTGLPGEYQHFWCIMSALVYGGSHPVFDTIVGSMDRELVNKGPGLNSGSRIGRGWADAVDLDLEPGVDVSLAIESLGSPGAGQRYNAISVKVSPAETYSIELRSPSDPYDAGVLCPMVVINAVIGSLADDTHPGTHSASYLGEIHKPVGGTFVGPGFEVEIVTISDDNRRGVVRIKENPHAAYVPAFLPKDHVPVYAIASDGTLQWYLHNGRDNARDSWVQARPVGYGWDEFTDVFPSSGGVMYAVKPNGDLMWYRHDGWSKGVFAWSGPTTVSGNWNRYSAKFAGAGNALYGVASNGDLRWYGHEGREDGSFAWSGPTTVDIHWDQYQHVFPGEGNVIYAIKPDGTLMWYRHEGSRDGTRAWTGPNLVGRKWHTFRSVFAGAGGVVYGVDQRGVLHWYRHDGRHDGTFAWTGPRPVGRGWHSFSTAFEGRV